MSEVEEVKVVRDSGFAERWGFGKYLYRQDGKKLTLQGKYVLGILVVVFVVTSALTTLGPPSQLEPVKPISFNGVLGSTSTIDIPQNSDLNEIRSQRNANIGRATKFSGLQVVSRPQLSQIPPGTMVRAKLINGASNGLVKAILTEPLIINEDVVASSGTTLMGNGSSTDERLLIDFTKLIFTDGPTKSIKAQACDLSDQTIGIKGSKIGKYSSMLVAGIGLNFASGLAEGLQESEVQNGVAIKKSDFKNAALNGSAKAAIEQSKEIIEKWKQQKTVIQAKAGTEICILFDGD